MELTAKQRAFADAVIAGMEHREAAIAAGYSERTAGPQGSRLAKNPKVAAFIKKYKKAGAAKPPPAPVQPPGPKFDINAAMMFSDPMQFLMAAMNDAAATPAMRFNAANALMPYKHARKGEASKKDEAKEKAKAAGAGKYAARQGPKLVSSR